MSSYDTWHNLLSGISQESFDKIYVKDSNGAMTDHITGRSRWYSYKCHSTSEH